MVGDAAVYQYKSTYIRNTCYLVNKLKKNSVRHLNIVSDFHT